MNKILIIIAYILLYFSIKINAQQIEFTPSIGKAFMHFAGNGSCSSTAVLYQFILNNPFNNNYSNALKYQIGFGYVTKKNNTIALGFNKSKYNSTLSDSQS
jgi:hypothetical protein